MAKHYNQGVFTPKNKEKYIGKYPIVYRSSWELTFMNFCDKHPSIIKWASESIPIPYTNPFTGRIHTYYPDFFMIYVDKNGKQFGEVIEIKPLKQSIPEMAKSRNDKQALEINKAKWQAALLWCKQRNYKFRVMTEQQIYRTRGKK